MKYFNLSASSQSYHIFQVNYIYYTYLIVMLGKPLLMLLLMPGLRPPDVGYNIIEQGWAEHEAWEELEKYAVTNHDLRNLGDKCIGTGICCDNK
jgi:hypothetical protein